MNSFITHWVLHWSGADSKVPSFSRIALSHICWVLDQSEKYIITNGNFFIVCYHSFLVSRWLGTNFSISGVLAVCTIFTINHFTYTKTKKKGKKSCSYKTENSNNILIYCIHCFGYIFHHQSKAKKSCWFNRFIFYDLYFGFYLLNASNIFYLTKHICVHPGLFLQQHIYLHLLLFYAYYYHLPRINASLVSIEQIR